MNDPHVIVCGFDRPNIHLSVARFGDEGAKKRTLFEDIATLDKPGIVYVATRREAEDLAGELWQQGGRPSTTTAGCRAPNVKRHNART